MKRTTLALDDRLLQELKERAVREGRSLQALANDLLRQAMSLGAESAEYRLELEGWRARTLPGVDLLDRDQLFDAMDER
jgi:plasmid stability protein